MEDAKSLHRSQASRQQAAAIGWLMPTAGVGRAVHQLRRVPCTATTLARPEGSRTHQAFQASKATALATWASVPSHIGHLRCLGRGACGLIKDGAIDEEWPHSTNGATGNPIADRTRPRLLSIVSSKLAEWTRTDGRGARGEEALSVVGGTERMTWFWKRPSHCEAGQSREWMPGPTMGRRTCRRTGGQQETREGSRGPPSARLSARSEAHGCGTRNLAAYLRGTPESR